MACKLYWQQRMWPDDFARIATLLPWIQYVGFRLSGTAVTEISSMACQTHLLDTRTQQPSKMAKQLGWDSSTHRAPRRGKRLAA